MRHFWSKAVHPAAGFLFLARIPFPPYLLPTILITNQLQESSCRERFSVLFNATKLLIKLMVIQHPKNRKPGVPRCLAPLLSEKRPD